MAISLNCGDLGADCGHVVSGTSMSTIVSAMQKHAVELHGYQEDQAKSDEMVAKMQGAVRQSSRPSRVRTSRLDL